MTSPSKTPTDWPLVSVVIPTFNKWEYTLKCLVAIYANTSYPNFEVIVVDNASSDGTPQRLQARPEPLRLRLNDINEGFARGSNQGAEMARGDYILFLNNDTEPQQNWMLEMVKVLLAFPDVAVVGSQLLFPDGTLQHAGVIVNYGGLMPISAFHAFYQQPPSAGPQGLTEFSCVTAACMLIRRNVLEEVGRFDEAYINGYEDVDLCFKVGELGHRIVYNPRSLAIHHESVSEGRHRFEDRNLWLLTERWIGRFKRFDNNRYLEMEQSPESPGRPGASVVLLTYQSLMYIVPVLERLLAHTGTQDEIIVVDRGSADPTVAVARWLALQHPGRIQIHAEEGRFIGAEEAWTIGLAASSRPYVAMTSSLEWVTLGWLDGLVGHLEADPSLGIVGPMTDFSTGQQGVGLLRLKIDPDVSIDDLARRLRNNALGTLKVEGIHPRCACIRREVLEAVIQAEPKSFFASRGFRLPQLVAAAGHQLAIARDVFIQSLWPPRNQGQAVIRTGLQRDSNLQWCELRRRKGRQPGPELWKDNVIQPQTEGTTIVVVVSGPPELVQGCLEALYSRTSSPFSLVVINNGACAQTTALLDRITGERDNMKLVSNPRNLGYAFGCIQGLAAATTDYVVLLDQDAVVETNWLSNQIALLASSPTLGGVGSARSDRETVSLKSAEEVALTNDLHFTYGLALTGPCLVLKRSVVKAIGGLDTSLSSKQLALLDFSTRAMRAKLGLAVANDVVVYTARDTDILSREEEGWQFFRSKWKLSGPPEQEVALDALVASRPFDPAFDRIPTRIDEVFRPGLEPIEVEGRRPKMLLMIPEWEGEEWKEPFSEVVRALGPNDPVGVLLRVEPPTVDRVEYAVQQVGGLLEELGVNDSDTPDMLLDTTLLNPAERGRLYAAATAMIPTGGSRAALHDHEARACGVPVLGEALGSELDEFRAQD